MFTLEHVFQSDKLEGGKKIGRNSNRRQTQQHII